MSAVAQAPTTTLAKSTAVTQGLDFPTETRPHVELSVKDVQRSVVFYQALFNRPPVEVGEGFARFNPYNPAVDFVLREDSAATRRDGHMGIQLKTTADIARYKQRVEAKGFSAQLEEAETACCFSVANKAWIDDPDGNQWEIFVVTGEATSEIRCGPTCACEAGGCN
ncbi:VOC family protein [Ideonella sp. DXS29W]|uniref:VOC family protein n=1 Tax=Ideonella lacteola TaxID=2984193 RepID=A0ABU9BRX3_9BURK